MITAAINFLIVAAVVYFVIVLPLNTLKARRKRGEESRPGRADGRRAARADPRPARRRAATAHRGRPVDRRRPQRRAARLTAGPGTPGRGAASNGPTCTSVLVSRRGAGGGWRATTRRRPPRRRLVRGVGLLVAGDLGQHVAEDLVEPAAHPVRQPGRVGPRAGSSSPPIGGSTAGSRPDSSAMTCRTSGVSVAMPSRTAARDDARFTTSVLPDTPTSPRDSPASTAPAASPEARIASAMPGIGRSSTPAVASAVTSRGETPVPPTVITRSTPPITAVFSALRIATVSPGTTTTASTTSRASSSSSRDQGADGVLALPVAHTVVHDHDERATDLGRGHLHARHRSGSTGRRRRRRKPSRERTAPALGGGAGADAILHVRRPRGTTAADRPRIRRS